MAAVLAGVLAGVAVALGTVAFILRRDRSRLAESERRNRLGAQHARLHLSLLARAGDEMASALESYDEALRRLVDVIVPAFADWFSVDLVDENGLVRRGAASSAAAHRHPDGDVLVRKVIETARDQVSAPLTSSKSHEGSLSSSADAAEAAAAPGVESMMIVPVHVRAIALGALTFITEPGRRGYRKSDLETAHGLADRVAAAIERVLLWRESTRAEHSAIRRAEQLRRLTEAALAVNAPLAEADVLRVLAEQARRVFGAKRASLCTVPSSNVIAAVTSPALPAGEPIELLGAICDLALELGRPVRSTPNPGEIEGAVEGADLPAALTTRDVPEAWLASPVPTTSEGVQRVVIVEGRALGFFGPEDESVAVLLCQMASIALVNAALYQEVRNSERRLRAVVESSPVAIAELTPSGEVRWWNSAAEALFGDSSPSEEKFQFPVDVSSLSTWGKILERSRHAIPTVGADIKARGRDDQLHDLSVSCAPLLGPGGEVSGILVVAENVTERKRILEQAHQGERLASMARLAGGLAHDFNNLLAVIAGSSELISKRDDVDPAMRVEVEAIERASQRAGVLTAQLLAIGRDRDHDPMALDPDAALVSITPMLRSVLGDRIELEHEPAPVPLRIVVDSSDFERAVLNLAINARDAMPKGGRFVLRTAAYPSSPLADGNLGRARAAVAVSVTDTGQGMNEQTASHCFDPFFSTKKEGGGTGLGLFAVQALVTQAGGYVALETHEGRGTTFTLWFPVFSKAR